MHNAHTHTCTHTPVHFLFALSLIFGYSLSA